MTVMSLGGAATEEDANLISQLFGSIGKIWKADDKYFDAITGLRYANLILQNDRIIFGYYVKSKRNLILSLMDENSEVRDAPWTMIVVWYKDRGEKERLESSFVIPIQFLFLAIHIWENKRRVSGTWKCSVGWYLSFFSVLVMCLRGIWTQAYLYPILHYSWKPPW